MDRDEEYQPLPIRLLGNRLVVEPRVQKMSGGGIMFVPRYRPPGEAILVAVGTGKQCEPYRVHVGKLVAIRPMEGSDFPWPNNRALRLMEPAAVLGVLEEEEPPAID